MFTRALSIESRINRYIKTYTIPSDFYSVKQSSSKPSNTSHQSRSCLDGDGEAPRLLALVLVTTRDTTSVGSEADVNLAVVQVAVSSVWLAVLEKVVGVEVAALLAEAGVLVGDVQGESVVVASVWVVWTWEEVLADAVLGGVLALVAAVLWWLGWVWLRSWRGGDVGAVVTVRAGDHDLELLAGLALVGGGGGIDAGAPQGALEGGHGWWVGAVTAPDSWCGAGVGRWVEGWVTLDEDVEGSAELVAVTEGSAGLDVVALEGAEAKVGLGAGGSVQVTEDLLVDGVANRWDSGRRLLGESVELRVREESIGSVWLGDWAVAIWLRSAGVEWVDEAAVSAILRLGSARLVGSGGLGGRKSWVGGVTSLQSRVVWGVGGSRARRCRSGGHSRLRGGGWLARGRSGSWLRSWLRRGLLGAVWLGPSAEWVVPRATASRWNPESSLHRGRSRIGRSWGSEGGSQGSSLVTVTVGYRTIGDRWSSSDGREVRRLRSWRSV